MVTSDSICGRSMPSRGLRKVSIQHSVISIQQKNLTAKDAKVAEGIGIKKSSVLRVLGALLQ
jgi:hypothetical protein